MKVVAYFVVKRGSGSSTRNNFTSPAMDSMLCLYLSNGTVPSVMKGLTKGHGNDEKAGLCCKASSTIVL